MDRDIQKRKQLIIPKEKTNTTIPHNLRYREFQT